MYVKGLVMPMDDAKNESKGFAFIEFIDKKVAVSLSLSFLFWGHVSFFFCAIAPQSARP
jgi:hypothetical protein